MMLNVFALAAVVAVSSAGCVKDCGCPASPEAAGTDMTFMICASTCMSNCMGTDVSMESAVKCGLAATTDCPKLAADAAAVSNGGLDTLLLSLFDESDRNSNLVDTSISFGDSNSVDFGMTMDQMLALMPPEQMQAQVDQMIKEMQTSIPASAWNLFEGPMKRLSTDKALQVKVMTAMMSADMGDDDGCTINCSGNQQMGENGRPGTCDCTGSCCDDEGDDNGLDFEDPTTLKMFNLLGIDMYAVQAIVMKEMKSYAVDAAKDAFEAAGCGAGTGGATADTDDADDSASEHLALMQKDCRSEFDACQGDCKTFLLKNIKNPAPPSQEAIAAAGPEAVALLTCYMKNMMDDGDGSGDGGGNVGGGGGSNGGSNDGVKDGEICYPDGTQGFPQTDCAAGLECIEATNGAVTEFRCSGAPGTAPPPSPPSPPAPTVKDGEICYPDGTQGFPQTDCAAGLECIEATKGAVTEFRCTTADGSADLCDELKKTLANSEAALADLIAAETIDKTSSAAATTASLAVAVAAVVATFL